MTKGSDMEHVCGGGCATRRTVLGAAGAVGVSALLAGCQAYGESAPPAPSIRGEEPPATGGDEPPATGGGTPGGGGRPALAKTSDIPVGGGKIFTDEGVVVTQPQAGAIKAFSATCTHLGCVVTTVEGGTINCSCHGSRFDIADGSVKGGPAPKPLPSAVITVQAGEIRLG